MLEDDEEPDKPAGTTCSALPLCPDCGVPMVLRTASRGPHQGEQFYGLPQFSTVPPHKAVSRGIKKRSCMGRCPATPFARREKVKHKICGNTLGLEIDFLVVEAALEQLFHLGPG